MNANMKTAINIATMAGATVLIVSSVMKIAKSKSVKEAAMPGLGILVGLSAFRYSLTEQKSTIKDESKA